MAKKISDSINVEKLIIALDDFEEWFEKQGVSSEVGILIDAIKELQKASWDAAIHNAIQKRDFR